MEGTHNISSQAVAQSLQAAANQAALQAAVHQAAAQVNSWSLASVKKSSKKFKLWNGKMSHPFLCLTFSIFILPNLANPHSCEKNIHYVA